MQWFLRRWDELVDDDERTGYLDMSNDTVRWFNALLMEPVGKDELPLSLQQNLDFLERLAVRLMAGAPVQGCGVTCDTITPRTRSPSSLTNCRLPMMFRPKNCVGAPVCC